METAATKELIIKAIKEAYDACVEDWNLSEIEHKNLFNALCGTKTVERIFNVSHVAGMYADEGKILLRATLKSVAIPADGKDIKLVFEVMNTHDRRMKIADIGYPVVDIFALPESMKPEPAKAVDKNSEQLDIEEHIDEMEGDEEEVE